MFFFFPDSQNQNLFIKMVGETENFREEEKIKKVEETKKEETAHYSQSQNTEKQEEIPVHDARIERMITGRLLFA